MKLFTKKVWAMVLAVVMVLGLAPAIRFTAAAADGTWELVTDASALAAGDTVIIAAMGSDVAMSTTQNTNNRGQADITKDGSTVTFGSDVQQLTLEEGTLGGTFALNTGSGYLYAAGGTAKNNHLKTQSSKSDAGAWTISIEANSAATIKAPSTVTRNWMRYNSSSKIFSCYASGQADICLYKFIAGDAPECTHQNVSDMPEIPAGDDTVGREAGTRCDDCGEYTTGGKEIPMLGYLVTYHVPAGLTAPEAVRAQEGFIERLPKMDDIGTEYTFIGWAEGSVADTTDKPAIHEKSTKFTPTASCTLYAVYSYGVEEEASPGNVAYYEKVTTAPADWSGTYLIVYENTDSGTTTPVIFNGGQETLDAASNNISVAIVDNAITLTEDNAYFTIATIDGGYSIQAANGKYIGQISNANGLKTQDTALVNSITFNAGNVDIVSGSAYLRYNATSGQDRFRYFKSGTYTSQQAIALYKKGTAPGGSTITVFHYTSEPLLCTNGGDHIYTDGGFICDVCKDLAASIDSVDLSANVDLSGKGEVALNENAVLDLKGKTLTVDSLDATLGGHVVDSVGGGKLIVSDTATFAENNQMLPITTDEGIIFEQPAIKQGSYKKQDYQEGASSYKYAFYVNKNDIDTLVDEGVEKETLRLGVKVSWTDAANVPQSNIYELPAGDILDGYVANWDTKMLVLTLTGLETLKDVKCQAVIISDTGVIYYG